MNVLTCMSGLPELSSPMHARHFFKASRPTHIIHGSVKESYQLPRQSRWSENEPSARVCDNLKRNQMEQAGPGCN